MLSVVHKTMLPFFAYYADSNLQMGFEGFSRFCIDFGIFPDILSKPQIFRFFKTLSGFFQSTKRGANADEYTTSQTDKLSQPMSGLGTSATSSSTANLFIDEHLFIEALALAAFQVVYKEPMPNNVEKIVLLLERMNYSEGPTKVQMAYGSTRLGQRGRATSDLTALLRASHPQYFVVPDPYDLESNFDDLLPGDLLLNRDGRQEYIQEST